MSKVFMLEPPKYDIDVSGAEVFGELITVFHPTRRTGSPKMEDRRSEHGAPSVFNQSEYARAILDQLDEYGFNPDTDFLLVTGGLLSVGIAFAALALRYRCFKTLVYNSAMSEYIPKTFDGNEVMSYGNTSVPQEK